MIYLYNDVVFRAGGIETYLHALALHLQEQGISFRVAVSEQEPSPVIHELVERGIDVYRQSRVRGDRWHLRKRLLNWWLRLQLAPGDWVYCVRQPMPELYRDLVRTVHARHARIAASWSFAPKHLAIPAHLQERFSQAVKETDAVISVAHCTAGQFAKVYGYDGPVKVVPYHNIEVCDAPVPLPPSPPFRIGYMGRIEIGQKIWTRSFPRSRSLRGAGRTSSSTSTAGGRTRTASGPWPRPPASATAWSSTGAMIIGVTCVGSSPHAISSSIPRALRAVRAYRCSNCCRPGGTW